MSDESFYILHLFEQKYNKPIFSLFFPTAHQFSPQPSFHFQFQLIIGFTKANAKKRL